MRDREKTSKRKMNQKILLILLAFLLVFSMSFISITFSRFVASEEDSDSAEVAKYVFDTSAGGEIVEQLPSGYEYRYLFDVSNYKDARTAEVAIKVQIVVTKPANFASINMELYRLEVDETAEEGVRPVLLSGTASGNTVTYEPDILPANVTTFISYDLKFACTSGNNSTLSVSGIKVAVSGIQID